MKIGELASVTGTSVETIRFYEQQKLIAAPPRSGGNYREYGPTAIDRLRFIRHCRALDMTLEEIRTLLSVRDAPDQSCGQADRLLDDHIVHVAERIAELGQLQAELVRLRRCCEQPQLASECGIIRSLGSEDPVPSVRPAQHGSLRRTHPSGDASR